MKQHNLLSGTVALSFGLFATLSGVKAQSIYSGGHGDIGLVYENGSLIPHWHLDAGGIVNGMPLSESAEYEPADLVAVIGGMRGATPGAASYLGVATGTPIYVGGSSAYQPNLGFGAEELEVDDWLNPITVTLTDWTLPSGGDFALYSGNNVFLSTYDPSTANFNGLGENVFQILAGSHGHFTFGFTAPGYYELTLEFSGTHTADGLVKGSGTYGFQVIPEPSTYALLALSGAGLAWLGARRHLHSGR